MIIIAFSIFSLFLIKIEGRKSAEFNWTPHLSIVSDEYTQIQENGSLRKSTYGNKPDYPFPTHIKNAHIIWDGNYSNLPRTITFIRYFNIPKTPTSGVFVYGCSQYLTLYINSMLTIQHEGFILQTGFTMSYDIQQFLIIGENVLQFEIESGVDSAGLLYRVDIEYSKQ